MARTVKRGSTALMVGTRKGAFIFHSADRRRWSILGPYLEGTPVYHMILDPRDGRTVYAGADSEHWGPTVHSARIGEGFGVPKGAPKFPAGSGLAVKRIWHVEPGPGDTLLAGVEPAALFRSYDGGASWEGYDALNLHPTRSTWQPGFGGLCLHSILVDPNDEGHLVVGISAVGTWESMDGGETWKAENKGVRAEFLPNKYPEIGQCVHKLVWDSAGDGSIFHQNHCGVYHRGPGGGAWTEVSKGLPSDFGFPMAADPHRGRTAFVIPLTADQNRVPPGGALAVWRTTNGGRRWTKLSKGLPRPHAYQGVLREGLTTDSEDPLGVYFGTNTGQLYASRDGGESWKAVAIHMPPILSVSAGEVL
jgi:hypothetical protein